MAGRIRFVLPLVLGALLCSVSTAVAAHSSADACRVGTKRAVIGGKVKCLQAGQTCQSRYQAAYKRYGFTCVAGRLKKRTPPKPRPPEPTPIPSPAPPAQAGHYHGTTSQLEVFDFDVTATGTAVTNIVTGQINEGCTPHASLSGGNFRSGPREIPIAADGSFKVDFDYTSTVDGLPATGHFTLTGRFTGANATGTLEDKTNFTYNGTAYACGSGQQSWTAIRTG